jgi:NADPH-dependent 7-cyano-7-deazaguanine reductase QueF
MLSREDQMLAKSNAVLKLQPNEGRCAFTEHEHELPLLRCCPVSGNPTWGSTITISYKGAESFLEIQSLREFVDSFVGGKGEIRSMEGMLQEIAQACANILRVDVRLNSVLWLEPKQAMRVTCYAFPK